MTGAAEVQNRPVHAGALSPFRGEVYWDTGLVVRRTEEKILKEKLAFPRRGIDGLMNRVYNVGRQQDDELHATLQRSLRRERAADQPRPPAAGACAR